MRDSDRSNRRSLARIAMLVGLSVLLLPATAWAWASTSPYEIGLTSAERLVYRTSPVPFEVIRADAMPYDSTLRIVAVVRGGPFSGRIVRGVISDAFSHDLATEGRLSAFLDPSTAAVRLVAHVRDGAAGLVQLEAVAPVSSLDAGAISAGWPTLAALLWPAAESTR